MGKHAQEDFSDQEEEPEQAEHAERKFPFSYTDVAEAVGAIGLAGVVVSEAINSGLANLAFFTAAGLLVHDIAQRRSARNYSAPLD